MSFPQVTLGLPGWVEELLSDPERTYPTEEDRMRLVVELSRLNVERGTGGPFGAAIFERETGRLLAPGMNLVVPSSCSVAHAEMVAIMIAQQVVGDFDLGSEKPAYELYASTEPCAMCFGATPWSGVRACCAGRATRMHGPSASTRGQSCPTGSLLSRSAASRSRGTCCAGMRPACSGTTPTVEARSTTPARETSEMRAGDVPGERYG